MQYYTPASSNDETSSSVNYSSPLKKRRCLNNKEQQASTMAGDSMSHRVIEKRRRDRMNNCLADLGKLIPVEYLKKARGRVEKTEIIEMAICHMKHLQGLREHSTLLTAHPQERPEIISQLPDSCAASSTPSGSDMEHYRLGYQECLSETMHFLVDVEGGFFARDTLYVQLIGHLQRHCENVMTANDRVSFSHSEIQGIPSDCPENINSDNGSSSGVSSFGSATDFSERPSTRPLDLASVPTTMAISTDDSSSCSSTNDTPIITTANNATNYKFKSSIKQRFSAERVDFSSRTSSGASPASSAKFNDKQSRGVPIFALHDTGEFYVPMIVESSLLEPRMTRTFTPHAENRSTDTARLDADIALHPVTISVNFYQSATSTVLDPTTRTHQLLQ